MVYSLTPPYCLYIALVASEYQDLISVHQNGTGTLRGNHPFRTGYERLRLTGKLGIGISPGRFDSNAR
jgi:hypothetical protein